MSIKITPPGPAADISGAGAASLTQHGVATGPAGNATITSIAAGNLVTGQRYQVDAYVYFNGTTASPADDDNVKLVANGLSRAIITIDGTPASIGRVVKVTAFTPPHDGVNAVAIQAIAAATGTAIYHATIIAIPLGD